MCVYIYTYPIILNQCIPIEVGPSIHPHVRGQHNALVSLLVKECDRSSGALAVPQPRFLDFLINPYYFPKYPTFSGYYPPSGNQTWPGEIPLLFRRFSDKKASFFLVDFPAIHV